MTVFILIMNQTEFNLIDSQKENSLPPYIPFNLKLIGNIEIPEMGATCTHRENIIYIYTHARIENIYRTTPHATKYKILRNSYTRSKGISVSLQVLYTNQYSASD